MTTASKRRRSTLAGPRQRGVALLLAALFLLYALLSGLMPAVAAAQDNTPIQLRAVCHSGPGAVQQQRGSDDAPVDVLPCCILCCSAAHEAVCAPPLAATLTIRAPQQAIVLPAADARPLVPHSHSARPQPARGPPALI